MPLLPPNHRIDFRGDCEYKLQVAVKFSLVNFRRELSQIPPTVCVFISKIALKQAFESFGRALPHHRFVGQKRHSPLSCALSSLVSTLSKTM